MGLVERFSQHASFVTKKKGKQDTAHKVAQHKTRKPKPGDEQSGGGFWDQNEQFDDLFG